VIVIGIDGATWKIIKPNLDKLPTFNYLLKKYYHDTLVCDVRPVHSAPSWTTVFTGLMPNEHKIKDFVMDKREIEKLKNNDHFIWKKVKNSIVLSLPISFPPISYNCELNNWEKIILSITDEEMFESTKVLLKKSKSLLRKNPKLFIVVFYETDRAQHIFWKNKKKVLEHYKNVDGALGELMKFVNQNFVILSDHGFTDAEETRKNNWDIVRKNQTGGHHPDGIIISNIPPPTKISDVYSFILNNI
jgi:predicted AlkP superfamily phosphohydrolase/phosphomutase